MSQCAYPVVRCYARTARRFIEPRAPPRRARSRRIVAVSTRGVNGKAVNGPGMNEKERTDQPSARRNSVTSSCPPVGSPVAAKPRPLLRLLGVKNGGVKI